MRSTLLVLSALLLSLCPATGSAAWTSATSATNGSSINASLHVAGRYVIVGGAGYIATSPDGTTWTQQTSGTSASLYGIAHGAGRYIAVGEGGVILSSSNGESWSAERGPHTTPLVPDINGIVYGKDRFVAVGRSGGSTTNENVMTSVDGRTWQRQNVDVAGFQLQFVAYGNGQYVAGGGGLLMVSPDAVTWRTVWRNNAVWLYAAAWNGSRWVVTGLDGTLLVSDDGAAWTQASLGAQRPVLYSVVSRGGRFLAAGQNSFSIAGNTASVFSSADGITWAPVVFPVSASLTRYDNLRTVVATDTGFLGFGGGGLMAESRDGITWTRTSPECAAYSDVVYARGMFVAVGSKATNEDLPGINPGRIGVAAISLDGVNWFEQNTGVRGAQLRRIAFGNGRFVAVGPGGTVVYSDDAVTWRSATTPVSVSWTGLAYGNGRFVAAGATLMSSPDGITWTPQIGPAASNLRFLAGHFYLSKTGGGAARSADGATWEDITLAIRTSLDEFGYGNGLFAAPAPGTGVQFSSDGRLWTPLRVAELSTVRSISWLGDRWLAVAGNGSLYGSTNLANWRLEGRPTDSAISVFGNAAGVPLAIGPSGVFLTTIPTTDPAAATGGSRIVNLSIRTRISPVQPDIAVGYAVAGNSKPLLVRAVGPGLAQFGVTGTLPSAAMSIFHDRTLLATNDGWSRAVNPREIETAGGRVGAFPLPAISNDAVVFSSFGGGTYSALIQSRFPNEGGHILLELYDANTATSAQLGNVSTIAHVGTGDDVLSAGFVIAGAARKSVLIRAVGPGLAAFGREGILVDPQLQVRADGASAPLAENNDWRGTTELSTAFVQVGAFPLATNSKDAAVVVALNPGAYSVQVSGVGATTGTALIEIYALPDSAGPR